MLTSQKMLTRARKASLEIEKAMKEFRKASLEASKK